MQIDQTCVILLVLLLLLDHCCRCCYHLYSAYSAHAPLSDDHVNCVEHAAAAVDVGRHGQQVTAVKAANALARSVWIEYVGVGVDVGHARMASMAKAEGKADPAVSPVWWAKEEEEEGMAMPYVHVPATVYRVLDAD